MENLLRQQQRNSWEATQGGIVHQLNHLEAAKNNRWEANGPWVAGYDVTRLYHWFTLVYLGDKSYQRPSTANIL